MLSQSRSSSSKLAQFQPARDLYNAAFEMSKLFLAAKLGNLETLTRLWISQGGDIDARDEEGMTALLCAAANGKIEAAKYLISQGAAITATDINGSGILHLAAGFGHSKFVKWLLDEKNVAVDVADKRGGTPLMFAALHGYSDIVEMLLKKAMEQPGAESAKDAKNADGMTPLMFALQHEAEDEHSSAVEDIVKIFIQYGADLNAKDNEGDTAYDITVESGEVLASRIILEAQGLEACAACGTRKKKSDLFVCSKCKKVYYCCRQCQVSDWPRHKLGCK